MQRRPMRVLSIAAAVCLASSAAAQARAGAGPLANNAADPIREAARRAPEVTGRTPDPASLPGPVFARDGSGRSAGWC
jgi:hypothetical protein